MKTKLGLVVMMLMVSTYVNAQHKSDIEREGRALQTIQEFKEKNWEMKSVFENAFAYVVFPSIGKGGIMVGGAHGQGILYKEGRAIGVAKMTQVSVGFQWGGQSYSEVIFFEDELAMEKFQSNKMELAAQASAIVVTAGISKDVPYDHGVAIYTLPKAGLMYEASVGGQKFKYHEKKTL